MPKSRTRCPLTLKLASSLTMADPQISAIAVGTVTIESIKRPANSRMPSKIRMFINVYLDFIRKNSLMARQIVEKAIKSLHERKYVNPETDPFWLIDYRTYDPEGDGKSKLDHLQEMLT